MSRLEKEYILPPQSTSAPSPLDVVANGDFVDELYSRWQNDPSAVSEQWQAFFAGFELASGPGQQLSATENQSRVSNFIHAYRSAGHLIANIDPLSDGPPTLPDLDLESFGLRGDDLDAFFDSGGLFDGRHATLSEIREALEETYTRSIGVEFLHIRDRDARSWLQHEMERVRNHPEIERDCKICLLKQLVDAEIFETFIQSRYQGQKRFSLEGAESAIPAMHAFMESASASGAEEVIVGMAHRGRLNVLANILHKPYPVIFHEFDDTVQQDRGGGGGDVKYHRGYTCNYETSTGKTIHISLTANPSHLEAVDPVVEGRTRAKQRQHNDTERRCRVLPLLLHGDAAFAGQGLVAETFNLSQLKGYGTGGTVHLVINNQIGFTTLPGEARSSRYSTDVAKLIEAPVFHVNGDDPEAVIYVMDLALRFRQEFNRDVVVDMLCYRRHGHNEGDEPAFTQPLMYSKISHRPTVRTIYQLHLEGSRVLGLDESNAITERLKAKLLTAFKTVKESPDLEPDTSHAYNGVWAGFDQPYSFKSEPTAVAHETLVEITEALTTIPEGFALNTKISRKLPAQLEAIKNRGAVDWAVAEALAFGANLVSGTPVRLSGQDCMRGTFSHRHAAWFDATTQEVYIPLNNIRQDQARFCVYNSMLSEAAVLGFDYGYALVEPNMLVLWEAQFGDFANGAQVIIDQFIAAAQDKWQRGCGLVMLLPHGYEGQGPEHSSAYMERYLLLCAENNIQVCNLSTPAQYFHALRRQNARPFRTPLVIMAPKSLLRRRTAVSPIDDLIEGRFYEILDDPRSPRKPVRLLLCSGKVYYDLVDQQAKSNINNVAIVRIEQLYPLNTEQLAAIVEPYITSIKEVIWVQEETANRGGWSFIRPHLEELFPDHKVRFAGREASASPATGSARVHRHEQESLINEALLGNK